MKLTKKQEKVLSELEKEKQKLKEKLAVRDEQIKRLRKKLRNKKN